MLRLPVCRSGQAGSRPQRRQPVDQYARKSREPARVSAVRGCGREAVGVVSGLPDEY